MVVGPRLERIFKTFDQDGELIKAWDSIVETLSAHDVLMWKAPHKPNFICVEESNRGGAGVNVPRAEDPEPPQKYFDRFHEFISCAFCLSSFLSLSAIEKILLKKKTHTHQRLWPLVSVVRSLVFCLRHRPLASRSLIPGHPQKTNRNKF